MTTSNSQREDIINQISNWNRRLQWDDYFMSLAFLISSRSSCHRLHVGCVLVKNTRVISVGYNGFLPKAPHQSVVVNGHEKATVHAEQNSISDCARRGILTEGATAYITHFPCIDCFKILAAGGIVKIIYHSDYKNDPLVSDLARTVNIQINQIATIIRS